MGDVHLDIAKADRRRRNLTVLVYVALVILGALLLRTERDLSFPMRATSPTAYSAVANGQNSAVPPELSAMLAASPVQAVGTGPRAFRSAGVGRGARGNGGNGSGTLPGDNNAQVPFVSGLNGLTTPDANAAANDANTPGTPGAGPGTVPSPTGPTTPTLGPGGGLPFPAITPIPEPRTWLMLILGFAGVGVVIRRRRAAADELAPVAEVAG
ncbi:MAG: PEPxxWA-CTERM sorting domain-containing protein [Novosphingobium sp.]|nr:PEPxxWA-CTERM sorting domain-containing protein [Novosphingobium sp.]